METLTEAGESLFHLGTFTSTKGPELSPWVQGTLQRQVALQTFVAMDTGSHEHRHLHILRSALTKASFMTILKCFRMTSRGGS